jgi:formylglycine-generating enzyme required for sulfatase activity
LPQDNLWGRGSRPVINVSWQDANEYAQWLSRETGKHYRLPTEAEWEYAAGNGGKEDWAGTSNANKLSKYAVSMTKQTEPVGSRNPTSFGLYDMSGNAAEWIEDCWHNNYDGAPSDGHAWKRKTAANVISVCCVAVRASTKSWTCVRGPETGSLPMFAHAFSALVSPETSNESALIPLPSEKP